MSTHHKSHSKKHGSGKKTHTKKVEIIEEVLIPGGVVGGVTNTIVGETTVIDTIQQEPVLGHVHGQQHTHTEQQTLVTEVIQQPITEVHKQPVISHIRDQDLHQTTVLPNRVEHIEKSLTEEERLRIASLTHVQTVVPQTTHEQTFSAVDHGETVQDVTQQALIQKVIQPIVTEIHHQNVVHEVKQPLTRIITEKPIIQNVVHEPIETWNATSMAPAGVLIHDTTTVTTTTGMVQNMTLVDGHHHNTGLVGQGLHGDHHTHNTGLVGQGLHGDHHTHNTGLVGNTVLVNQGLTDPNHGLVGQTHVNGQHAGVVGKVENAVHNAELKHEIKKDQKHGL